MCGHNMFRQRQWSRVPVTTSNAICIFLSYNNIFFLLFLCIVSNTTETAATTIKLPGNVSVPAVIIFGDSIVDTGNNNNNFKTFARCNFLPYGKDLKGGMPTGRFSNGKVPSDFIVEALGIKELLPAYLDPTLQPEDLLTGVVIAAGGAGYDPLTAQLSRVASLSDQLKQFQEYVEKLKGIAGEERTNFIIANSLIFVVAGSNDISNTYFLSGARKSEYDVPSYTDFMLNYASPPPMCV
ncbi:GDSL esterase/lipase At5g42170-like [Prunus avium]|uniref:GDSL esterase/lipase At5g42170-like n=1 Tax=Prunus avium TaxID=42229 RepID=A0A6P5TDB9_PRUAV|nr:GDSL esterase/lipase At5g42170-like [Prunus avium]